MTPIVAPKRPFQLVRWAVLVCSHDVIGSKCYDCRVYSAFPVQRFVSEFGRSPSKKRTMPTASRPGTTDGDLLAFVVPATFAREATPETKDLIEL